MVKEWSQKMKKRLLVLCSILFLFVPSVFAAETISLDRQSPSVHTYGDAPGEIFRDSADGGYDVGGPGPVLNVDDTSYGIGASDNNDGHSIGEINPNFAPVIYFSADDGSHGVAGSDYRDQADLNQAAGDLYRTSSAASISPYAAMELDMQATISGSSEDGHILSKNQDQYNEIPTIGPGDANPYVANPGESAMDDMDALELNLMDVNGDFVHDTSIYFSLDDASPSLGSLSAADILLALEGESQFSLYAEASALGLSADDDIDALAVYDMGTLNELDNIPDNELDHALFSLAPDSPFLFGDDGIEGTADDYSAADIFVTDFSGSNMVYISAAELGLEFDDNLNALDVAPVPIPAAVWMLGSGLMGLIGFRKRYGK
jgi:hypothetical protein